MPLGNVWSDIWFFFFLANNMQLFHIYILSYKNKTSFRFPASAIFIQDSKWITRRQTNPNPRPCHVGYRCVSLINYYMYIYTYTTD